MGRLTNKASRIDLLTFFLNEGKQQSGKNQVSLSESKEQAQKDKPLLLYSDSDCACE